MKRLAILQAVKTKLEAVSQANGYNFDYSKIVYWQDLPFEYGESGAINFKDPYEAMTRQNLVYQNVLNLKVCAIKFSDDSILVDSEYILEDLITATKDETWGGLSISTFLINNDKVIETAGKTAIKVTLTLQITYRE